MSLFIVKVFRVYNGPVKCIKPSSTHPVAMAFVCSKMVMLLFFAIFWHVCCSHCA